MLLAHTQKKILVFQPNPCVFLEEFVFATGQTQPTEESEHKDKWMETI
jgi:hypothetical protein